MSEPIGEVAYQNALRRLQQLESEIAEVEAFLKQHERLNRPNWQISSLDELLQCFPDEDTCLDQLRAILWKDGPRCPYCQSGRIYHFSDHRNHKCGSCRKRFSIKVGTIFADTKLPLQKWFMAIWLVTHCGHIPSTEMARTIGVAQTTAWWMLQKLRKAAETKSINLLDVIGETDPNV